MPRTRTHVLTKQMEHSHKLDMIYATSKMDPHQVPRAHNVECTEQHYLLELPTGDNTRLSKWARFSIPTHVRMKVETEMHIYSDRT